MTASIMQPPHKGTSSVVVQLKFLPLTAIPLGLIYTPVASKISEPMTFALIVWKEHSLTPIDSLGTQLIFNKPFGKGNIVSIKINEEDYWQPIKLCYV